MSDSYWTYRPIEYVPDDPPLETSLFDDRQRLSESWDRALETMRAQAALSPAAQDEVVRRAEELLAHLRGDTQEATPDA